MRRLIAIALGLALASVAAAQHPIEATARSPYLDVVEERTGRYSGGYCTVRGEVQSRARVTITASLGWRAYDFNGTVIGTALILVDDIPAGGRQAFESTAFSGGVALTSCSRISRIERYRTDVHAR